MDENYDEFVGDLGVRLDSNLHYWRRINRWMRRKENDDDYLIDLIKRENLNYRKISKKSKTSLLNFFSTPRTSTK